MTQIETRRTQWSAEEYDFIEMLLGHGLPVSRAARLVDPPVASGTLADALRRAGIEFESLPGRPSHEDSQRWDRLEADLADLRDDWARDRIRQLADRLGYTVEITKKPPEDLAPAVSKRKYPRAAHLVASPAYTRGAGR